MTAQPSTLQLAPTEDPVELSRADLYGLLAALWLGPPDAALLERLRNAPVDATAGDGQLREPWQALVAVMQATSARAAADEYVALFEGVGKPEVFLYGSYYLAGTLNERPLARLRETLLELGLTRDPARAETEDHAAFLFEVMRYLIAGDDVGICNLERQRRFFRDQLQPWIERMCEAVDAHPRAAVWRAVAGFTTAFMQVETQGFDLLET